MVHERHYTRDEANALLPELEATLAELRQARDRLTDAEAHSALADAAPANGGGADGRHVGEGFLDVRRILADLEQREIVVRDIDRGLVDFPAIVEGREAYLCWELGEAEVGHWHDLETGFAGRRALD